MTNNICSRFERVNDELYLVQNVPGDGNCFFHCLSFAFDGNFKHTQMFRNLTCQNILNEWSSWETKVQTCHGPYMSNELYEIGMLNGNWWAGACEIESSAALLNCKINIYLKGSKDNKPTYTLSSYNPYSKNPMHPCSKTIDLLLNNNHFLLLKKCVSHDKLNQTDHTASEYKPHASNSNEMHTACNSKQYHEPVDHSYCQDTFSVRDFNLQKNCKFQPNLIQNCRKNVHLRPCSNFLVKDNESIFLNHSDHTYCIKDEELHQTKVQSVNHSDHTYSLNTHMNSLNQTNTSIYSSQSDNKHHVVTHDHNYSLDSDIMNQIDIQTINQTECPRSFLKQTTSKRKVDEIGNDFSIQQCKSRKFTSDTYSCTEQEKIFSTCRKLGISAFSYLGPQNKTDKNTLRRVKYRIKQKIGKIGFTLEEIPDPPPLSNDVHYNTAMDCIRAFELEQMSYQFNCCKICKELRLVKDKLTDTCKRCHSDKGSVKLFSSENFMDPQHLPVELQDMSIIEQQLICRISPCINVHMLKHGGIASCGHCVTFPQEIDEPAQIFPRLPKEINIIAVRKHGKNESSKEFRVRRFKVQKALSWLKTNNPAYSDITISQERLTSLPTDGELLDIHTVEYCSHANHLNDLGPAPNQLDPGHTDGETVSGVLLPDRPVDLHHAVQKIVSDVLGENSEDVSVNRRGTITIPWPSRGNTALSEFTTQYFFTLAFPCLFPFGTGDFHINRPRTCLSLADWAEHLLWYEDGRFANHQYFKFVVHNMIMRKSAIDKGNFIVNQQIGDQHITISELKNSIKNGDYTLSKKIVYLSATLRGTSQYWAQRAKELQALTHYKISKGNGLPSIFATGSCAEFHFKPLKRLLSMYVKKTSGEDVNLDDRSVLFKTLQQNTHIVAQYFDFRTTSYFSQVMGPVFGVDSYWYRQEFAKSRGMIHWHGLCWRSDREPHVLLHKAISDGLSDSECAEKLSEWASIQFGLTANHPAGKDHLGNPRQDLWPPPEGCAPEPPEEKNPLVKLLMDVSSSQDSLLEDHLLLTNRFNIHRCSDYCLKSMSNGKKTCRLEFGTPDCPGKLIRNSPALVKDKNGSMRLEMARDHPMLVQHSKYHTQGWRANGDISLILSKGSPDNPSVDDITATLKYITGYACKGNQPTGAISDLFNDLVNCADDSTGTTAKSLCNKVLISTVKRDISAVEASFELSRLPLYRSSHQFKSVSLSGVRLLERDGSAVTRNNALDQYLNRKSDDCSSFYNFVSKGGKVPVFTGCCTQPNWPLQEDYCRSMLILHWPNWRNLSDIKNENSTWCEKMNHFLSSPHCPNFVKADIERVKQRNNAKEIDDDQGNYSLSSQQPDWMDVLKPNADFECPDSDFDFDDGGENCNWSAESLQYPADKGKEWLKTFKNSLISNEESLRIPDVNLHQMNADQKFAFNIILSKLLEYSKGDINFEPLRMIVTGTAGSGKSFLIKCIVKATRLFFNENSCVQVVCPTGNSAHIISGVTLHSFFKVPTFNKGKELSPPQGSAGEELQTNCRNLLVLLVDERSLIGASTLGWMEHNCRYGVKKGLNCQQSWGGLPVVVFFGDDVQLPPVLDSPVYDCNSKMTSSLHGVLVWKEFSFAVCLKTIVRQDEDEKALRDALLSLREYQTTAYQAKWLQNFQWRNLILKYGNQVMHTFSENSLYVFPTHAEVWNHNKQKILDINEKYPIAKIMAINKGHHAKLSAADKAGGLSPVIYLCKYATVMLTVNLCVNYGLFNGAIGTVVDILYPPDKKPCPDTLPTTVMVLFNNYTGPAFVDGHPKVIPIMPVERSIDCVCNSCKRKQVPLKLGWATTIHKCQGMTIGNGENHRHIIINPGTRQFESRNPGALFVALSRAKSAGNATNLPDFAWHSSVLLNEDRICHVVRTKRVQARMSEVKRIAGLCDFTDTKFASCRTTDMFMSIMKEINLTDCPAEE